MPMQIPPEISYRDFEPGEELEARVADEIARLERFFDRITSCRVVVEQPHRRRRSGNPYHVRIDVTVPGRELVVSRDPGDDEARKDPVVAVEEAFAAMQRQLEDHAREIRGETKRPEGNATGRVVRLFPGEGYGFLRTPEGRELYFHENAVLDGSFEDLDVGSEVRFAEGEGIDGPRASTVHVLRNRVA